MKTIIAMAALITVFSGAAFSANYEETMTANIQKLNNAKSVEEFTGLANQFERIGNAENGKWQPYYYAAYSFLMATFTKEMSADEKHKLLDLAQTKLDLLGKTFKSESEIYALQAFVYQIRITDMMKGMKYSGLSNEALDQAEKLNPDNPRVYYLRGTNMFHTPKAFGGGMEKAKPLFEKAARLFESRKPADAIEPVWGSVHNSQMLARCNEVEKE